MQVLSGEEDMVGLYLSMQLPLVMALFDGKTDHGEPVEELFFG